MIVEAFQYIISKIVTFDGMPNLLRGSRDTAYSEYVFSTILIDCFRLRKNQERKVCLSFV